MRFACALGVVVFVAGCGGAPVGEKVPRPNTNAMAVGAAAAATAATLADPTAAGKQPEGPGTEPEEKAVPVKESVPENVLDRADDGAGEEDLPPCKPAANAGGSDGAKAAKPGDGKAKQPRLDLIPVPIDSIPDKSRTPERREKCRDVEPAENDSKP